MMCSKCVGHILGNGLAEVLSTQNDTNVFGVKTLLCGFQSHHNPALHSSPDSLATSCFSSLWGRAEGHSQATGER